MHDLREGRCLLVVLLNLLPEKLRRTDSTLLPSPCLSDRREPTHNVNIYIYPGRVDRTIIVMGESQDSEAHTHQLGRHVALFCFEICPRFIPHLNPCLQLSSRTTTRSRAQQYVLLKRGNDKLLALLFLHLCLLLLDVCFMRPMMWMSSPGPSLIDLFPNSHA